MLTKLCGPERDLELGLLTRTTSSTFLKTQLIILRLQHQSLIAFKIDPNS